MKYHYYFKIGLGDMKTGYIKIRANSSGESCRIYAYIEYLGTLPVQNISEPNILSFCQKYPLNRTTRTLPNINNYCLKSY